MSGLTSVRSPVASKSSASCVASLLRPFLVIAIGMNDSLGRRPRTMVPLRPPCGEISK